MHLWIQGGSGKRGVSKMHYIANRGVLGALMGDVLYWGLGGYGSISQNRSGKIGKGGIEGEGGSWQFNKPLAAPQVEEVYIYIYILYYIYIYIYLYTHYYYISE